ncbi:hypothetical protein Avbf_00567 [Armadillidium vulgare]|nr:hypothetical protein Avbf_00567 [Armadillidium vulgare]
MQGQSMDPNTKWYSSDEECDMNNTQGNRRNQNNSPPQMRRQRIEESSNSLPTHGQFSLQQNLADIDVMYLKNVLSAVQNQSSQNQNFSPINSGMKEERSNNLWEQNSNRYSSTDSRTSFGYMDISDDIKEVFYDEPKENFRVDQFSANLDSFLQRARSKSLSNQSNYKDDFRERNVNNKDFKFQNSLERNWNQNNSDIARDGRDKSHHSAAMKIECPSGDPGKNFTVESGRYSREENSWDNKRVHDCANPFNGLPFSSKDDLDFQDRTNNAKGDTDLRILTGGVNRQTSKFTDRSDSASSSIYDFDYRLIDSINSSIKTDDNMSTLPFKVPVHSSAKEIDASYKVHIPIVYKLIKVDIPKPDFSKIKINQDDKKIMEDPRLRKMLRRSSLESPASPRENFEASPDISIQSPTTEFKESRDPRKLAASRDPRTEAKAMVRADPRPDPRMTSRADPRSANPRVDPRFDMRDTRLDIRDPVLDSDVRDADPRFGNQMYPNGIIDGHSFQQFLNNNLNNSILPDPRGPDPRGKPGLLGAAPSPKRVPVGLPGTINQGIGGNPFLLSQPMGCPSGHYNMNDDRGDMMSGSGPPFPQNPWGNSGGGGGRMNLNDPRLNRDLDMGS